MSVSRATRTNVYVFGATLVATVGACGGKTVSDGDDASGGFGGGSAGLRSGLAPASGRPGQAGAGRGGRQGANVSGRGGGENLGAGMGDDGGASDGGCGVTADCSAPSPRGGGAPSSGGSTAVGGALGEAGTEGPIAAGGEGGAPSEGAWPPRLQIAAGNLHSCLLRTDGTVSCWGAGYTGQLGDGTTGASTCVNGSAAIGCALSPVRVSHLTDAMVISLGNYHGCAIRRGGALSCWGLNDNGQLGVGTNTGPEVCLGSDFSLPCSPVPVAVSSLSDVTSVSAADESHTCAVAGGAVSCWGLDAAQFGTAEVSTTCGSFGCSTTPVVVPGLIDVGVVRSTTFQTCALRRDHSVWCWGTNLTGTLGDGTTTDSAAPVRVGVLDDVVALATGSSHSCVIRSDSSVWCWGANSLGQLGTGSSTGPDVCEGPTVPPFDIPCSTSPVVVPNLSGATAITAGGTHACALLADGTVACWGANNYGQLGVGSSAGPATCTAGWAGSSFACSPAPVVVPELHDVVSIAAGGAHTCAVTAGGHVVCWGYNVFGQLGDGTTVDSPAPVTVPLE